MLQNIWRQFYNGLFMTVQHVISIFHFNDVQLRNGKFHFWTKTKWTIVIYFQKIKEISFMSLLMHQSTEYTYFCPKNTKNRKKKIHVFPRGVWTHDHRIWSSLPWPLDQKNWLKNLIKMMEQNSTGCLLKISVFSAGRHQFSKKNLDSEFFKHLLQHWFFDLSRSINF